jgi:hypothetical protein
MIIDSIVNEFRSIVGDEWFLDSPEDFAVYSYDGFLLSLLPAMCQDDQGEGEERKNRYRRVRHYGCGGPGNV